LNPISPFFPSSSFFGTRHGLDIYSIGDKLFSQRFTQLLNTFWISTIAASAITGNFSTNGPADGGPLGSKESGTFGNLTYAYRNTTGKMTPDYLKLTYHKGWLATLIVASCTVLCASVATAVLGVLRRGPDVLDRTSLLLKDNPFVRLDIFRPTRKTNVRFRLSDAKTLKRGGYVTIGDQDRKDG
jgi:hypothetical protein